MRKAKVATRWLIFLVCTFLFVPFSCKKFDQISVDKVSSRNLSLEEAMAHYKKIAAVKKSNRQDKHVLRSADSGAAKIEIDPSPMWDVFQYRVIESGSQAVLTPLYQPNTYIKVDSNKMVGYGFLNYLMMYKDSLDNVITEKVLLKPSLKWLQSQIARKYDGDIIVKSFEGQVKRVLRFEDGVLVKNNKRRASSAGSAMRADGEPDEVPPPGGGEGGDDVCLVVTTYVFQYVAGMKCGCMGHAYGDPVCTCTSQPPTPGYTATLAYETEISCPIDDDPPVNPPGGGSGGTPGDQPEGNGHGGGGTSGNDYPPLNCNPDPNYTVPTEPPPPGTDYILPCSEVEVPVEDPDDPPPVGGGEAEEEGTVPCADAAEAYGKVMQIMSQTAVGGMIAAMTHTLSTDNVEKSFSFGKDASGQYATTPLRVGPATGTSVSIQVLDQNMTVMGGFHTHPSLIYDVFSAGDVYTIAEANALNENFQHFFVIGAGGSTYALSIIDPIALSLFLRDFPKSSFFDPVTNDWNANSIIGVDAQLAFSDLVNLGRSPDEAMEMTLAFILKEFDTGLTLSKQNANGIFEGVYVNNVSNTASSPIQLVKTRICNL